MEVNKNFDQELFFKSCKRLHVFNFTEYVDFMSC